jgi:hypothetical protein
MFLPNDLYNEKFSEYIESIKTMYLIDEQFRTICDEYCLSKLNTKKYKEKFEKDFRHALKNENLSRELEEEILIYIIKKI